jgi:hypothetical protein
MTMEDRGDDPAAPGARPAVPAALAAMPAGAMVRVSVQTGGRRVLLGVGTWGGIEPGILETGVRAVASPDSPYRAMIRAALAARLLDREAGLVTWIHYHHFHRLLHGLNEEKHSVERLTGHYGVDSGGLLDQLATGALRCQVSGHPAPITAAHCRSFCQTAKALAVLRESLVAVWESRVRTEIDLGSDRAQAVELLNLDALYCAVELEFERFVFGAPIDPLQANVLVLLRAAAAVRRAVPQTPADVQARAPLVELFEHDARTLADSRLSIDATVGTAPGFLDEIRATEHLLRTVRPRSLREGRPRFTVEREVASNLVRFLVQETGQKLLGHAAALLSVTCPGLSDWPEAVLRRMGRDDTTLCGLRPDELPRPARTWYLDLLSRRLDNLLHAAG